MSDLNIYFFTTGVSFLISTILVITNNCANNFLQRRQQREREKSLKQPLEDQLGEKNKQTTYESASLQLQSKINNLATINIRTLQPNQEGQYSQVLIDTAREMNNSKEKDNK
jgi:hypothetical protein